MQKLAQELTYLKIDLLHFDVFSSASIFISSA